MIDPELRRRVEAWRDDDPDTTTADELDRLLAAGDEPGLRDRFDARLRFGTAGLRGALGAGPNRMNRAVVRRAAASISTWLEHAGAEGPVVVGHDARHGSRALAEETAAVVAGAGRDVVLAPVLLPTPLVAFSVVDLAASAGVMVTASHNPAGDNGYKVYAADGAQIATPDDETIGAGMDAVAHARDVRLAPLDAPRIRPLPDAVVERYLDGLAALRVVDAVPALRVAYTPLHGVGAAYVRAAFERSGFAPPRVVAEQAEPDPAFPTAPYPNPEERGVMDLVVALAREEGADLALANDPDADRLAVAVPDGSAWRVLTGDEVGILLADHLLRHTAGPERLVATTVVSSSMLRSLAGAHGVRYAETLTGFKWLARASLGRSGTRNLFAYEEALGYCVGELVRDKDGISAAVLVTELVAALRAGGSSPLGRLDELAAEHGVHLTSQWSGSFEGRDGTRAMGSAMARLRARSPRVLAGVAVDAVEDLSLGGALPPTDAVVLRGAGLRVVVRPSGTEPKLKAYVEAVEAPGTDVAGARRRAARRCDAALADIRAALRL